MRGHDGKLFGRESAESTEICQQLATEAGRVAMQKENNMPSMKFAN